MEKPDLVCMHVIETTWRAGAKLRPAWAGVLAVWFLSQRPARHRRDSIMSRWPFPVTRA